MLPTEPQIFKWLSENYPTVLIALIVISLSVYAALKLNAFMQRIESLEKEMVKQKAEWLQVKTKLALVVLTHCQRHSDDMAKLMKVESEDE
jgi:hypothetical protein